MKLKVVKQNDATDIGIRRVSDIKRPRSWAVYGRSGAGKTTFAASFPKPILLLDVRDQGTDSVSDHEDMYAKDIDSIADLEDAFYYLKERPVEYKSVIIDTVTQLQQLFMEEVVGAKKKRVGDWGSMSRREFGDVAAMMKEWILNYRNLTANGLEVLFIAQERTSTNEEENPDNMVTPEVGPHVMPSVAIALNASVSIIGNSFIRMKSRKIKTPNKQLIKTTASYCMRVGANPVYVTKIRKPKDIEVPAFIENPTYNDVIQLIEGE